MINIKPAKNKAWKAFSIYIRTRDALKTTGTTETAKCVTCDRIYPIKAIGGLQAGHFLPNRHNSVLFDERNCHAQCYGCNVMKKGNMVKYYKFMLNEYGQDVIDELETLDQTITHMKPFTFVEIAENYKKKLKDLLANGSTRVTLNYDPKRQTKARSNRVQETRQKVEKESNR